jgi:hypothetical protein
VIDFAVIGLPRSATTWLSNWLTTDTTLCLHDPFAEALPQQWDAGGKRLGISCTGAYLMPDWFNAQDCPVAIIERDHADCSASLAQYGLLPITLHMRRMLGLANGRRFAFADLWNEARARELWTYLLPGIAFDAMRYRLLSAMQVQPHPAKVRVDFEVLQQLQPMMAKEI